MNNKMFNKKIKLHDIEVGSLIWVEFGETKHLFLESMRRQTKENCFEIEDCPHGLNLMHEFSYKHMAILISNKFNDTVAVVPITEKKDNDEKFLDYNIILTKGNNFSLPLMKDSTIKIDQLRFIDKTRVISVEKKYISKTLLHLINKKVQHIFK
jgi:uncharacterized protein YifN (PemK superfamily)